MSDQSSYPVGGSFDSVSAGLNRACNRFEIAWKAGEQPQIEDYLPEVSGPGRARLLTELLRVELEYHPSPDPDEYRRRFPGDLEAVEAGLRPSHSCQGHRPDSATGDQGSVPTLAPTGGVDSAPDLGWEVTQGTRLSPPSIPGYEILGELGRGGMGVVYQARQVRLKRLVALKMILGGRHADPAHLARFRTEQEAAARFQHPSIIQIHEIGEHAGLPYCVLELVDGGSLAQQLANGPLSVAEATRLAEALARAAHYAHQRQVVHRDLKPANVLLTADGTPKVADFGLAKQLDDDSGQTGTGQILGTPSYMAPEQAEGRSKDVGPATDVYALGAILYEMLTGKPPFKAETVLKTLEQIRTREPEPPSQLRPGTPRDLETICLTCLAKESAQRYSSALALAQDLERFQAGEPILARPEGALRKLRRRFRRHRPVALAALAGALALAVAGVVTNSSRQDRHIARLQGTLEAGFDLDASRWTAAHAEQLEVGIAELEALAPPEAKAYRHRLADRLQQVLVQALDQPRLDAAELARFDDNLERLAALAPDREPELKRLRAGRLADWETVFDLRSNFGGWEEIFAAGDVDLEGSCLVARPRKAPEPPARADPAVLTKAPSHGRVQLEADFDASWVQASEVGLLLHVRPGHSRPVKALAWAPDSRALATGSGDRTVRLWDLASGQEKFTLSAPGEVVSLAFTPDGRRLLVAADRAVTVWDTVTGSPVSGPPLHPRRLRCVAVSPDGALIATGGDDGTVRLFVTDTWAERAALPGHAGIITQVAFAPDSKTLASAGLDRTIRFWDAASGTAKPIVAQHPGPVQGVAWAPDGQLLATVGPGRVALWDVPAAQEVTAFADRPPGSDLAQYLAFSRDGKTLALGSQRWDVRRQRREPRSLNDGTATAVAFSPDGSRFAAAYTEGYVRVLDSARQAVLTTLSGRSYSFALVSRSASASLVRWAAEPPISLEQARQAGGRLFLQVRRNGVCLREQEVQVTDGPLTLRASRAGDRLLVQVNRLPPLIFQDVFALPEELGNFGLLWPEGMRVTRLRASRQPLPPAPSQLESGDAAYGSGRLAEALDAYQKQIRAAGGAANVQEARYKAAVCLAALNRSDEATMLLERVAGEPGDRWPLLAACQLWLLRLRQNRPDEAETAFASLSARYRFEELAAVLPDEDRRLLATGQYGLSGLDWLLFAPGMESRQERTVRALDYLNLPWTSRVYACRDLVRAYHMAGRFDDALRLVGERIQEGDQLADASGGATLALEYSWLLRLRGQAAEARAVLERWRARFPAGKCPGFLWLEMARVDWALGDWDAVQGHLAECLQVLETAGTLSDYTAWSGACLIEGFRRERVGDTDGARAAWRRGLLPEWRREVADEIEGGPDPASFIADLHYLILADLTDDLSAAEGERLRRRLAGSFRTDSLPGQVIGMLNLDAAALKGTWQTARGREYARRIALRTMPFEEYVRAPVSLILLHMLRRGAFPDALSAEQDDVAWGVAREGLLLYTQAKLSRTQVMQLGLTWKGTTNFLGWASVGPDLPPSFRGPVAYLLGHRFLRLGKKPEAVSFFRTALADAPLDSPLRQLAQAAADSAEGK